MTACGAWISACVSLSCFILLVSSVRSAADFAWGTATASYQIEGAITRDGRLPSIWDTFCDIPGKIYQNESGAVADDGYDKYMGDAQLMVSLGLKYYRFSVAWPRILPDGVTLNPAGIAHYRAVINDLKANGITPLLTLYHWDLPQAVYEATNGGWTNASIVDYYLAYADAVFDAFHEDVQLWLTFNEPWTFCQLGYGAGTHAPGRCSDRTRCAEGNSSTESYLCAHNVLLSHAAAVNLFRERGYDGQISITLNSDWAEPASASGADAQAAQRKILWSLAWFADPVWFGDYPQEMKDAVGARLPRFTAQQSKELRGTWDFFGLNSYTTNWVADAPVYTGPSPSWDTDQYNNVSAYNQYNGTIIGPPAASSWLFVVPWGIYNMLQWIDARYEHPPIYVTENGVDVPGENSLPIEQALHDTFRVNFYSGYIQNVLRARADGVNVLGYFAWSLMDNFEWADGYHFRFGIHYVDYNSANLTRYQKDSAVWYSNFTKHNP